MRDGTGCAPRVRAGGCRGHPIYSAQQRHPTPKVRGGECRPKFTTHGEAGKNRLVEGITSVAQTALFRRTSACRPPADFRRTAESWSTANWVTRAICQCSSLPSIAGSLPRVRGRRPQSHRGRGGGWRSTPTRAGNKHAGSRRAASERTDDGIERQLVVPSVCDTLHARVEHLTGLRDLSVVDPLQPREPRH